MDKKAISEAQVMGLLQQEVKRHGGLRRAAKVMRCSPAVLSMVLAGERSPGPAMAKHLGLVRRVRVWREVLYYRRNGR